MLGFALSLQGTELVLVLEPLEPALGSVLVLEPVVPLQHCAAASELGLGAVDLAVEGD